VDGNNDSNVNRKISSAETVKGGVDPMELGVYIKHLSGARSCNVDTHVCSYNKIKEMH